MPVQKAALAPTTATSATIALTSAPTVGNKQILSVHRRQGGGASWANVSDTPAGWTRLLNVAVASNQRIGVAVYARETQAGDTGSVTVTGIGGSTELHLSEWSGLEDLDRADKTVSANSGTTTVFSQTTGTTDVTDTADELLLGFWMASGGSLFQTPTVTNSFTLETRTEASAWASRTVSATGAYEATLDWTGGSARPAMGAMLTLRLASTGQTIAAGKATETDTAAAIEAAKATLAAAAAELDTARTASPAKIVAVGQAQETDTATSVATSANAQVGRAAEDDTAQPITKHRRVTVGRATDTQLAQAISAAKAKAAGQATEVSDPQPVTLLRAYAFDRAAETDLARPVRYAVRVGRAVETNVATALQILRAVHLGQAIELDQAGAFIGMELQVPAGATVTVGAAPTATITSSATPTATITAGPAPTGDVT